jgi:uncharacterized protein YjdB
VGTAILAAALAAALVTACKDEILKVIEVSVVEISGAPASMQAGAVIQLTVVLKDDRGNRLSGRTVSFQTSAASIATVTNSGLVTAAGPGSVTITASSEGRSNSVTITVTPVPIATIVITPAGPSLQINGTVQLAATARDAGGNALTGRTFTWTSLDVNIATVTATGLVTARAAGSVVIRATAEGVTGSVTVTVTAPVATVTVSPTPANIDLTATLQLTATARDASGTILTGRVFTWTSANVAIATVSATGLVTARGVGTVTISAQAEGKSGDAVITVTASRVAMAYAYANQSAAAAPYTPPGANLAGGTLQVTRTAIGAYTVVFGSLGAGASGFGSSFTVMVDGNSSDLLASLPAPTALCNLSQINANVPLTASVNCEDPVGGTPKDARFRILVVGDNALAGTGAPAQQGAFSGHTNTAQAAGSPYTPSPFFAWNSAGAAMSVTFQGGGLVVHNHGFAIQNPGQGRLATGFGAGTVCYPQSQDATTTTVRCLNRAGPVNSVHTLMTAFRGRPAKVAGYAHVDPITGPWAPGSFNSGGGAIGFQRVGVGRYQLTFNGTAVSTQIGIVTSVQGGAAWFACNHFLAGSNPVIIEVACFNPAGSFADPVPAFSVFFVE